MKLYKLKIQNFRKLNDVEITFGDATFLIGANNAGKSSTLDAIDYLVSTKNLSADMRSRYVDPDTGEEVTDDREIIIAGEFRDVPLAILGERGFYRERLQKYTKEDGTNGYSFVYRVRYSGGTTVREMQMHSFDFKAEYAGCEKPQDFVARGVDEQVFQGIPATRKISPENKAALFDTHQELFDISEQEEWFPNPGGIAGNVLSKLPRYLTIGTEVKADQIEGKTGELVKVLNHLFEDVRNKSEHYVKAQEALNALSAEMDPSDQTTEFGQMMTDLNHIVENVFPKSAINVDADLSDPDKVLKPTFNITMSSNVRTAVNLQGTGMLRSAVFALLRYVKHREAIDAPDRGLIIGFEEPELFLHPNAANNMRNIIYELANGQSQVICTTHSPYMIDISRKENLVLNSYNISEHDYSSTFCFNHSEEFKKLQEDDRTRVKMIQKIDDYVARVFFAQKVVIVEGDTEDVVFKKTIEVMPEEARKYINDRYQIIKAVGKATIISFVKYLRAMNVDIFVVHDRDQGTPGAERMNQPILDAVGDASKRLMMQECIEDELGYQDPGHDKPFTAYEHVKDWATWDDVPDNWKNKMRTIFADVEGL